MAGYNHFYKLPVYKRCRAFRIKVSKLATEHFPRWEEYGLKAQVLNSTRSVTANIAEGFGRFHHQENVQFCRVSRGSLSESMDHRITAFDEKYISKDQLKEVNADYKNCLKVLIGYVKYLKSARSGKINNNQIINNK